MENINGKLFKCRKHIDSLPTLVFNTQDIGNVTNWFQELCNLIADALLAIRFYIKSASVQMQKNNIQYLLLYLTRMITLLALLIQLLLNENEAKAKIMEARYFIAKELHWCVDGVQSELEGKYRNITEHESFQKMMDVSLQKLSEIDVASDSETCLKQYYVSREYIEEVLCYSMSIAQVTYEEDSKLIRGSCKTVLSELDAIFTEICKADINIGLCNLSIDSCYDKLCSLERKLNTCVLKLSLRVFSHYLQPLEELINYCYKKIIRNDELDDVIAEFDLHIDRMMQIGFFATTSTCNLTSIIKMKSCLASLEALESELVPNLNAIFNSTTDHNKHFAFLLINHWKQQATTLKDLVFAIIDPFTLCQVAYEEIKLYIDSIENSFAQKEDLSRSVLSCIVEESTTLIAIITSSIQDVNLDNIDNVNRVCKDVKQVIYEIQCAVDALLVKSTPTNTGNGRIIKRCKVLKGLIKKLLLCFAENEISHVPDSIVKNSNVTGKLMLENEALNKTLEDITSKAKQMVKQRSILCRTTTSTGNQIDGETVNSIKLKCTKKPLPLLKLVHLRNIQFSICSKSHNDTSLDLQITAILADLENLSTLSRS